MFGIESLDVMIGIVTVYLIFALACTAIVEAISSWLSVRSSNLEVALGEFLHGSVDDGKEFTGAFFAHPVVQSLSKGKDGRPSYIPPEIIGQVVTSLICAKEGASSIKQAIANLPGTIQNNRIKGVLDALQSEAQEDMTAFRKLIEYHYDAAMDRASGWYKKKAQTYSLIVSTILVLFANVDTIQLANSLSANPDARAKMIEIAQLELNAAKEAEAQVTQENEAAQKSSNDPMPDTTTETTVSKTDPITEAKDRSENAAKKLAKANADLSSAGIQLGWSARPSGIGDWTSKISGLLISILAISLGAPFWFDMLNRVMQIRAAGVSPREKNAP
ncbi:MAG: hypothetical protein M0P59_10085 [Gallionella sp.]|jgi:hypothetical protein|nr:hypothetical protein [Gallionella sp.]MCK9354495.1 hypothetical protein [Gallionella sp.]